MEKKREKERRTNWEEMEEEISEIEWRSNKCKKNHEGKEEEMANELA